MISVRPVALVAPMSAHRIAVRVPVGPLFRPRVGRLARWPLSTQTAPTARTVVLTDASVGMVAGGRLSNGLEGA